jgi:hypothetical protein
LKFEIFLSDSEVSVVQSEVIVDPQKDGVALSGSMWPNLRTIGLKEEGRTVEIMVKHSKYSTVKIP